MKRFFTICILTAAVFLAVPTGFQLQAQQKSGQGKGSDALKLNTVVLDAGHGGKDAGCVSADRKTYEKNITLSVVKKLGALIKEKYPEVKVVYTRTTDTFITLNNRASTANRNNADLFISIHVNSVGNNSKPNGFSVHVLGQSRDKNRDLFSYNSDICKRENSVIQLEDDYTTKYQGFDPSDPESFIFFNLMSNAFYEQSLVFAQCVQEQLAKGPIKGDRGVWQDPFYVLWKTSMPAALIEIGFISNKNDLAVMRSESGREQIADRLFKAFENYKTMYDKSVAYDQGGNVAGRTVREEVQAKRPALEPQSAAELAAVPENVYFGVQIMTLGRKLAADDPSFKGYAHRTVVSGNTYKYIIGIAATEKEARSHYAELSAHFPGCFVVKVEGEKVFRLK